MIAKPPAVGIERAALAPGDTGRAMSSGQIVRKPLAVRAQSGRTLDQRLGIRFPRLFGSWARLSVGRLPPTSRVRRASVWRGSRHGMEAFNRRDIDAALVYAHPDFEYRPPRFREIQSRGACEMSREFVEVVHDDELSSLGHRMATFLPEIG